MAKRFTMCIQQLLDVLYCNGQLAKLSTTTDYAELMKLCTSAAAAGCEKVLKRMKPIFDEICTTFWCVRNIFFPLFLRSLSLPLSLGSLTLALAS